MAASYRTYEEFLAARTPAVRARILRLNPEGHDPGSITRGYHSSNREQREMMVRGFFPFRELHGTPWETIPVGMKKRCGRRRYVSYHWQRIRRVA